MGEMKLTANNGALTKSTPQSSGIERNPKQNSGTTVSDLMALRSVCSSPKEMKINPQSSANGTKGIPKESYGAKWITWIGVIAAKLNPLSTGTKRNLNNSNG